MARFAFTISGTDGAARTGAIAMQRGEIRTPAFMPVGTAATVKAMKPHDVRASGADIILGNTYHLMLRPGAERVAKLGGLHKFMNWPGPILTDSGGFQVMSLEELRKITEEGVTFRSHLDGTPYALTPERAVEIQELLDADITMVLDECTTWPVERREAETSMRLSLGWAERSKTAFRARPGYALGFLVCAGLIGFALYLQHYQYQNPCPLCILQRMIYIALMAIFLVAALHGPARTGALVYGVLLVLTAGLGAAVAGRHVWLQHLPPDRVPECGPGLEFMLRQFPLAEALPKILAGSGQCAEASWRFLGLTIAGWSLVWFVILGVFAVWLTARVARPREHRLETSR